MASELVDQYAAAIYDIGSLAIEEPDGLYVPLQTFFTQIEYRFRGVSHGEEFRGRLVDTLIGRLGRKDDGHEQFKGRSVAQLRGW